MTYPFVHTCAHSSWRLDKYCGPSSKTSRQRSFLPPTVLRGLSKLCDSMVKRIIFQGRACRLYSAWFVQRPPVTHKWKTFMEGELSGLLQLVLCIPQALLLGEISSFGQVSSHWYHMARDSY